jgi:hypothetical protein
VIDQESTDNLDRLKPGVIIAGKCRVEGLCDEIEANKQVT